MTPPDYFHSSQTWDCGQQCFQIGGNSVRLPKVRWELLYWSGTGCPCYLEPEGAKALNTYLFKLNGSLKGNLLGSSFPSYSQTLLSLVKVE